MGEKILVIDDDPGLLNLMRIGLEREGYEVVTARGGKEGLRRAYETHPDLILLDVMMPDMDGWATCQRLRYVCDTPIIMLTARATRSDVVKGLSMGADDYLTKPCNLDELKARIQTVLRRSGSNTNDLWRDAYDDGNLRIDLTDGSVARRGETIPLSPTESRLLLYLACQRGRIVPKKELLLSVWGPEYEEEDGYLSVYIRYLRRKIEDDPSQPRYIQTRWRVGYYFAGDGNRRAELMA